MADILVPIQEASDFPRNALRYVLAGVLIVASAKLFFSNSTFMHKIIQTYCLFQEMEETQEKQDLGLQIN